MQRSVKMPHHFLERKQNCRYRCIEGRCQCRGGTDRKQGLDFPGAKAQPASEDGRNPCANVDGRAFSSKSDAARERR